MSQPQLIASPSHATSKCQDVKSEQSVIHWRHVLVIFLVLVCGCTSFGPRTLTRDQLDYGRSVGDSWKNQMLANLVKLRYFDMPVFVDVGQIVSGYSLETAVSGVLGFNDNFTGSDSQGLGASGRYTDRPTITYTPKTGDDYLTSLMKPVEPSAVLALVHSGYSPKLLFTWAVESINGIRNYTLHAESERPADPKFNEFVQLLSELQASGAIAFEIKNDPKSGDTVILRFNDEGLDEGLREKKRRASEIIGLDESAASYRVVYSPMAIGRDVLAMQTRSVLQMMINMSGFIDVPPDKASRSAPVQELPTGSVRPFHVHSGPDQPDDAFASYRYNGDWYWIEHDDLVSKRVFTLMLFVTTLTNKSGAEIAPVLTIPTS